MFCAAVLDAFSRRIIGWSIDSQQDSTLVINALNMAIRNRRPEPGEIVHADHFSSVHLVGFRRQDPCCRTHAILRKCRRLDNAMMESFWSSMQIELLNRKKWKTRLKLANAIFDYIEIFYNRQRRHPSLDYRTPIEHEPLSEKNLIPA